MLFVVVVSFSCNLYELFPVCQLYLVACFLQTLANLRAKLVVVVVDIGTKISQKISFSSASLCFTLFHLTIFVFFIFSYFQIRASIEHDLHYEAFQAQLSCVPPRRFALKYMRTSDGRWQRLIACRTERTESAESAERESNTHRERERLLFSAMLLLLLLLL